MRRKKRRRARRRKRRRPTAPAIMPGSSRGPSSCTGARCLGTCRPSGVHLAGRASRKPGGQVGRIGRAGGARDGWD